MDGPVLLLGARLRLFDGQRRSIKTTGSNSICTGARGSHSPIRRAPDLGRKGTVMNGKQRCVIRYQVATYSGTIVLYVDPNEENDAIKDRARTEVRRMAGGSLPFGYQAFKIVSREECNGA